MHVKMDTYYFKAFTRVLRWFTTKFAQLAVYSGVLIVNRGKAGKMRVYKPESDHTQCVLFSVGTV